MLGNHRRGLIHSKFVTMKIALVSPYDFAHPSGVNIHISNLGRRFTYMGHRVKIIAPCSRPNEISANKGFIFVGKPLPLRIGGSVVRITPSPHLFFSPQVRDILDEERFDVIHLHEPFLSPVSCAAVYYSQAPLNVATFHAARGKSWAYSFWKPMLNRWFVPKLDGRIAVSQAALKLVSRYFPGSYAIIPNGVDINRFSPDITPIEDYNDGKLNILFVGRLEKAGQREGLKYLLRAYRRVKEQFPPSRLIVVAPHGGVRRGYEGTVARWGLRDVAFHDYVPNEDLPPYYKTADIFCAPTTGRESFGIILLEAMATGKPIVASDIEGYSEVVRDGVEGLLVKPKDEEALANALSKLLLNKPLRERIGAMGRRKAEDYGWESIAQRVMDYYERLLELPRRQEITGAG